MSKFGGYMAGGLLKGLGQGMNQVGQRRYEKERAAADDLRRRSLMEFGWEHDTKVKAEDREYNAGLLEEERTYQEEMMSNKVTQWHDAPDGKKVGTNALGQEVSNIKRAATTGELALEKAEATAKAPGKYDNQAHDDGREILGDDMFARYSTMIKEQGGEDLDMSQFTIKYDDGTTGFNMAAVKANFPPELYREFQTKQLLVEQAITAQKMRPAAANQWANQEFESMTKKAQDKLIKDERDKSMDGFGFDPKVEDDVVEYEEVINMAPTYDNAATIMDLKKKDPVHYERSLNVVRKYKPELMKQINVWRVNNGQTPVPTGSEEYVSMVKEGLVPDPNKGR